MARKASSARVKAGPDRGSSPAGAGAGVGIGTGAGGCPGCAHAPPAAAATANARRIAADLPVLCRRVDIGAQQAALKVDHRFDYSSSDDSTLDKKMADAPVHFWVIFVEDVIEDIALHCTTLDQQVAEQAAVRGGGRDFEADLLATHQAQL